MRTKKATLKLMCGLPRCGKTTWIKKNIKDEVIVSPDIIRKEIFGHQYYQPANKFTFAISEAMASLLLKQGKDVIIDATHMTKKSRASWYPVIKETGAKAVIIWVFADPRLNRNLSIAKKRSRLSSPDERVPDEVLERMTDQFEQPDLINDGWATDIIRWENA